MHWSRIGILLVVVLSSSLEVRAEGEPIEVNVSNFVRAETDQYFARVVAQAGIGRLIHYRAPTSIQQQDVIRMNRDTLYSGGIFDVTSPVSITMPESRGRFQSLLVINQDHYMFVFFRARPPQANSRDRWQSIRDPACQNICGSRKPE